MTGRERPTPAVSRSLQRLETRTSPETPRHQQRKLQRVEAVKTVINGLINNTSVFLNKSEYLDALITLEASMGAGTGRPDTQGVPAKFEVPDELEHANLLNRSLKRKELWHRAVDHWIAAAGPMDLNLHSRTWILLEEAVTEHIAFFNQDIYVNKPDIGILRYLVHDQLERRKVTLKHRKSSEQWAPRARSEAQRLGLTDKEVEKQKLVRIIPHGVLAKKGQNDAYIYGDMKEMNKGEAPTFLLRMAGDAKGVDVYRSLVDGRYVIDAKGAHLSKLQINKGILQVRNGDVEMTSVYGGNVAILGDAGQVIVEDKGIERSSSVRVQGNCGTVRTVNNFGMHKHIMVEGDVERIELSQIVGENQRSEDEVLDIVIVKGEVLNYQLSTTGMIYSYGMANGETFESASRFITVGTEAQNRFERLYPTDDAFLHEV